MKLACPTGIGAWTFAACYRQRTGSEAADLFNLCNNTCAYSSSSPRVLLLGKFNLDAARQDDSLYCRRVMLKTFSSGLDELGFVLENKLGIPRYSLMAALMQQRDSDIESVYLIWSFPWGTRIRRQRSGSSQLRLVTIGRSWPHILCTK